MTSDLRLNVAALPARVSDAELAELSTYAVPEVFAVMLVVVVPVVVVVPLFNHAFNFALVNGPT